MFRRFTKQQKIISALAGLLVLAGVGAYMTVGHPKALYLYPGHPFGSGKHATHKGMPMVESDAPALAMASETEILPAGWTVTASDTAAGFPASSIIDGDPATIWHSDYAPNPDTPLPHTVTIDMKRVRSISRVTYLPRQTGLNGQIGRYQVYTSLNGTTWGSPVTEGLWSDAPTTGAKPSQFADFSPVASRFVRLVALTEAGNRGPLSSIAELEVFGSTENYMAIPSANWTVTASDSSVNYPVSNVFDQSDTTLWHSDYAPDPDTPLPHSVTVDMKTSISLRGFSYLPRPAIDPKGRIGQYVLDVSQDGTTWTQAAAGTWADDATEKGVQFATVMARYARLTALTEAGNRGPWSSMANLEFYDTATDLPMLPRTGWTAAASDAAGANPASYLLDGNSKTIWHSDYAPNPDSPLPHSVTIDMKQSRTVTGLAYQPRQDSPTQNMNGTIGQYTIAVSPDGVTWTTAATGTWADNLGLKTTRVPTSTARYIRLTALTEAGNRGPWSSGSEIYVHTATPTVSSGGAWGKPVGFPLVPTSAVVLPNNKLLVFSAYSNIKFSGVTDAVTKVAILDLNTDTIVQPPDVDTDHQMFCSGIAMLPDGRVLINGGSGDAATTIYDPFNNTWIKGPLMTIPRAYQGTTLLSNGNVFTLGGSWADGNTGPNKDGELFTPSGATGSWRTLPGVTATNIVTADPAGRYRADNHAWLFAASNGNVFHAGPSKQMNWISTSGNGSIAAAGIRGDSDHAMNGTAVMFDVNKILSMGGAAVYQDFGAVFNSQATNKAHLIDLTAGYGNAPTVSSSGAMAYQRVFGNSVVLPDGTVLALGGQQHPEPFLDTAGVTSPELWSSATNSFRTLTPETLPRTYHSLALLLPDGRVFSGGGGLCGTCKTNHTDGQVFSPPYLFDAAGNPRPRPTISSAPATATRGTSITVTTSGNTPNFSLVRMSGVTHSVNNDQRRIPLTPTAVNGANYTLSIPADSGTALPGYYMLFALDASGTPSVSKIVRIP